MNMGIIEKLGKMGVPGFRSGKNWKMAIATIGYLFVIFFIIIPFMFGFFGFTHPAQQPLTIENPPTPTASRSEKIAEIKSELKAIGWNQEKYIEEVKFYDWVVNSTAPCGNPMTCPDRKVIESNSVYHLVEAKLRELPRENKTGQEAGWYLVFSNYLIGLSTLNMYFISQDIANISKSEVDRQAAEQWKEKALKYFNESRNYRQGLEDYNFSISRLEDINQNSD